MKALKDMLKKRFELKGSLVLCSYRWTYEKNNDMKVATYRERGRTTKGSYITPIIVVILKLITVSCD